MKNKKVKGGNAQMRKTTSYVLMALLAFSIIPLALAAGDQLSTSGDAVITTAPTSVSPLSQNDVVNPADRNSQDTIERFERIIENAKTVSENLGRDGYDVSSLNIMIQDMESIKDKINPDASRKENSVYIDEFEAKVVEFRSAVKEMAGSNGGLRNRFATKDRFERISDAADAETARLTENGEYSQEDIQSLNDLVAQMHTTTNSIPNHESRSQIQSTINAFKNLIHEFKDKVMEMSGEKVKLRSYF